MTTRKDRNGRIRRDRRSGCSGDGTFRNSEGIQRIRTGSKRRDALTVLSEKLKAKDDEVDSLKERFQMLEFDALKSLCLELQRHSIF